VAKEEIYKPIVAINGIKPWEIGY